MTRALTRLPRITRLLIPGMLLAALLMSSPALAGWRVIPIRLDLDQRNRSGVITLINEGENAITFAVEASLWTQDPEGQDSYQATDDLVFFPKVLTIEPGAERVIRAGLKSPPGTTEKAYRLFIREAVDPGQPRGTAVAIAVRFGVPIFVAPAQEKIAGKLLDLAIAGDEARVTVTNTGNSHFRIGTIEFSGRAPGGEIVLEEEVKGWYLLAGTTRTFSIPVSGEICGRLGTLTVEMNADRLHLERQTDVDPAKCAPQ